MKSRQGQFFLNRFYTQYNKTVLHGISSSNGIFLKYFLYKESIPQLCGIHFLHFLGAAGSLVTKRM